MKNLSWSNKSGGGGGGAGRSTPYCFCIHFNSLEEDWTSFQYAVHPDQPEIMAGIQELLNETLCHAGGQSEGP